MEKSSPVDDLFMNPPPRRIIDTRLNSVQAKRVDESSPKKLTRRIKDRERERERNPINNRARKKKGEEENKGEIRVERERGEGGGFLTRGCITW